MQRTIHGKSPQADRLSAEFRTEQSVSPSESGVGNLASKSEGNMAVGNQAASSGNATGRLETGEDSKTIGTEQRSADSETPIPQSKEEETDEARRKETADKGQREREEFERNLLLHHSRRASIERSPPMKGRTHSLDRPDFKTPRNKKRKAEGPPRDSEEVTREKNLLWHKLVNRIGDLYTLIRANPKTKIEIKNCCEDLQGLSTILNQLEGEIKETEAGKPAAEASTTPKEIEKISVATQTEQQPSDTNTIQDRIIDGLDNTQIKQLIQADWLESVYTKTKMCKGSILGSKADDTRVLLVNKEKFGGSQLEKNLIMQVPGLKRKNASSGGLMVVESRDSVKMEVEEEAQEESRLTVVVSLTIGQNGEYDEDEIINNLRKVRQHLQQKSVHSISMAFPDDTDFVRIRKILECCFAGSEMNINLHPGKRKYPVREDHRAPVEPTTTDEENLNSNQATADGYGHWSVVRTKKKKGFSQRQGNIIVVKQEGKTYAEMLRAVKVGVNPAQLPAGAEVTSIQRSRNEELLIRVKGSGKSADAICKAVSEKAPGIQAKIRSPKKAVFHVSDLDEETSKEDVIQGIRAELRMHELDQQEIIVTSIRPAFAGTQKATVKLPQAAARQLAKKKRVRIGCVSCRIKIRDEQLRCFKCWETGHTAHGCKGPDKSGLCFKCGKAGHQKAFCEDRQLAVNKPEEGLSNETVTT